MVLWIILGVLVLVGILVVSRSVRIVPQARAGIVERFGKYRTSLPAGLNIVTPFVDRVRYMIDLREQVVSFPPQPVITEDNLVVSIDTVIYFQVTNPVAATYEIANYIQAIEQLTMTTLRNITGGMDLEQALTSRDEINNALRGVLDEATGKWGIRVNRVELKGIDPPPSIKDSMEKQMRADRDKRAAILTAEGMRQSQILTAEGQKQSAILTAEGDREALILRAQGDRQSRMLRAQGEGQAILTVFQAIHDGQPDQALLAYQYLQMLPKIAEGDANKVWIVPSEIGHALEGLGSTLGSIQGIEAKTKGTAYRVDYGAPVPDDVSEGGETGVLSTTHEEVAEAIASAEEAARPTRAGHSAAVPSGQDALGAEPAVEPGALGVGTAGAASGTAGAASGTAGAASGTAGAAPSTAGGASAAPPPYPASGPTGDEPAEGSPAGPPQR
jgi:regulator of protease activity HflC (stomatin/prohibitin superfamily)